MFVLPQIFVVVMQCYFAMEASCEPPDGKVSRRLGSMVVSTAFVCREEQAPSRALLAEATRLAGCGVCLVGGCYVVRTTITAERRAGASLGDTLFHLTESARLLAQAVIKTGTAGDSPVANHYVD